MPDSSQMPDQDPRASALVRQLSHKSTTAERVNALFEIGFAMRELADVIGVSDESVRGWRNQSSAPRRQHGDILDDLRAVALILLEGGLSPEGIKQWFRSTPPGRRQAPRPLEVIASDPQAVAAAAVSELEEDYDTMADILYTARRPEAPADPDQVEADEAGAPVKDEKSVAGSREITGPARRKRIRQQRNLSPSDAQ
jgi:DNA-binding transcriptional regulator YiaG